MAASAALQPGFVTSAQAASPNPVTTGSSTMKNLAYLDPGSASIMIQMIGGGVAAAAVTLKLFWRRILRVLHLRRDAPDVSVDHQ
jgi:hypothetical protein